MLRAAPVLALVGVVAGILIGEARGAGNGVAAFVACAVALAVVAVARTRTARVLALAVLCLFVGVASMQRALHGLERSPLQPAIDAREEVVARVTLVDDPDASRWSANALVRVDAWTRTSSGEPTGDAGGRRVLASASGDAVERLSLLAAGESMTVTGWLAPLDGFDVRMKWKHAIATLHVLDVTEVGDARDPTLRLANRARTVVMGGSTSLAPIDRAVLAGFLLGDTRAVPPEIKEQFRAAGLTHLTAVSGGNVAFVLAVMAPLFRRLRLGSRAVAAGVVLVVFGTMTRWEPSVARAIVMASIALFVGVLGRPTPALRALVFAATVLLLIDPFLLHSVGFGLSCLASLGIALWSRPITERLRGPLWIREILGVTAAAQIGVAPLLIPVFGSVPLVSLPANLVAVPLAAPLTMWGIVAGAINTVAAPFAPSVPALLAVPTTALLHGLLAVAAIAARVPIAVDGRAVWLVIATVALVAAAGRTRSLRRDARPLPAR
ncbi:MAG: ComEC/Rec2 family competence protein [Acidimicrobiia bacterium]